MNHLRRLLIDLSYACNIQCTTCRCPDIDADTGAPMLPLDVTKRTIDQFAALGGESVGLYGGEPLLVGYVYDVVQHAAGLGLQVRVTTNGMAATAGNARRLLACGLAGATVSVDGDETGHELIRGKGTFSSTMRGAENLMAAARELGRADFSVELHVTVSRANVGAFAGLIHHAAQVGPSVSVSVTHFSRLDADVTHAMEALLDQPADDTRNHWRLSRNLLLTAEDLPVLRASVAQMKQLAAARRVPVHIDPALDEAFDPAAIVEGVFTLRKRCPVFETTLIVGPDGAIGSCPMLTHFSFGHVPTQSVSAIWDSPTFHRLRRRLRDGYLPVCGSCCRHGNLM